MVANAGASIPAPLAIPVNFAPLTFEVATFGTLSVVIIAREMSSSESIVSLDEIFSTPEMILSIGSKSPIRPVEQTTISPAEISSNSATRSAVL